MNNSITKSTMIIFVMTLLGYVIGFVSQLVLAHYFGVTQEIDIFISASIIPEFLFGVTNAILFTSFVIYFPEYSKKNDGNTFINQLFTFSFFFLLGLVVLIILLSSYLAEFIAPGFSETQLQMTSNIIKILSCTVFFFGISSLLTGILHHEHKFIVAKSLRILIGIGIIIGILIRSNIIFLSLGMVFGIILAVGIQFASVYKIYSIKFTKNLKNFPYKELFALSLPLLLTSGLYYANKWMMNLFASTLGVGAITILNYAFIVVNIPIILIVNSVSAAIFPTMTKYSAYNNNQDLTNLFSKGINGVLILLIPLMIIILFFSKEIILLLFERGQFTATEQVGTALFLYTIGLVPLGIFTLVITLLNSIKKILLAVILYTLFLISNLILILVLKDSLSFQSIALAYSISNWIVVFASYTVIKQFIKLDKITSYKVLTASGIMAVVLYALVFLFDKNNFLFISIFSLLFYSFLLKIFHVKELEEMIAFVKRQVALGLTAK